MIEALPQDTRYVLRILGDLFPAVAEYRGEPGAKRGDAPIIEKEKRIFHPRCFRQYFLLKVPSELFSQRDFDAFVSSLRKLQRTTLERSSMRSFARLRRKTSSGGISYIE